MNMAVFWDVAARGLVRIWSVSTRPEGASPQKAVAFQLRHEPQF